MRIIIFSATGDVGSRIVNEALQRGHSVTGVVRNKSKLNLLPAGVVGRLLDVNEAEGVASVIAENDIAISALRPPDGEENILPMLT